MVCCTETMRNAVIGAAVGGAGAAWLASQKELESAFKQGQNVVHQAAVRHFSQPQFFDKSTGRPSLKAVSEFHRDVSNQDYVVQKRRFYGLFPLPQPARKDRHSGLEVVARQLRHPPFVEVLAARWHAVGPGVPPKSFDRVLVDAGYSIRPTWGHLSRIAGKAASSGLARVSGVLGAFGGVLGGVWLPKATPPS